MAKVNYKIKKGIQIMIKEGPISLTKKIHCSIKKKILVLLNHHMKCFQIFSLKKDILI